MGWVGRELSELARIINKWGKIIFIDDVVKENKINDFEKITSKELKEKYNKDEIEIIIALGDPMLREKVMSVVNGYNLSTLIYPDVQIPESTKIGNGVIIQKGCFIAPNVELKDNVLIQHNSCVGHDTIIEEYSVIYSRVSVSGHVKIGKGTYIGIGVPIKDEVSIGSNVIVGMGSAVIRNIPDNVIALGNPARPMKEKNDQRVFK